MDREGREGETDFAGVSLHFELDEAESGGLVRYSKYARGGGKEGGVLSVGTNIFVAFTSAEFELFGVVADECDACGFCVLVCSFILFGGNAKLTFGWVAWLRTKITSFDPHDC